MERMVKMKRYWCIVRSTSGDSVKLESDNIRILWYQAYSHARAFCTWDNELVTFRINERWRPGRPYARYHVESGTIEGNTHQYWRDRW